MKIEPKSGILLIKKHKTTALKTDIVVEETDNDKRLITGEVIKSSSSTYQKGDTVVFGKYALFQLTVSGIDYFFLSEEDVIAITDYKE